jgi:urease accessory protein
MDALLLLLLDSRSPAGAHHHSGGMEPAIAHGLVDDAGDVEQFCRTRLATSGLVTASFAALACNAWQRGCGTEFWTMLDVELDARLPSEALRAASRSMGRGLLRLARVMRPDADWPLWSPTPHHPLVLGAAVGACGGGAELAARAAALGACSGAASAAVRLLSLDPLATSAMLARLAPDIDRVAREATAHAGGGDPAALPADTAPALDLLADVHRITEVRLFAS